MAVKLNSENWSVVGQLWGTPTSRGKGSGRGISTGSLRTQGLGWPRNRKIRKVQDENSVSKRKRWLILTRGKKYCIFKVFLLEE